MSSNNKFGGLGQPRDSSQNSSDNYRQNAFVNYVPGQQQRVNSMFGQHNSSKKTKSKSSKPQQLVTSASKNGQENGPPMNRTVQNGQYSGTRETTSQNSHQMKIVIDQSYLKQQQINSQGLTNVAQGSSQLNLQKQMMYQQQLQQNMGSGKVPFYQGMANGFGHPGIGTNINLGNQTYQSGQKIQKSLSLKTDNVISRKNNYLQNSRNTDCNNQRFTGQEIQNREFTGPPTNDQNFHNRPIIQNRLGYLNEDAEESKGEEDEEGECEEQDYEQEDEEYINNQDLNQNLNGKAKKQNDFNEDYYDQMVDQDDQDDMDQSSQEESSPTIQKTEEGSGSQITGSTKDSSVVPLKFPDPPQGFDINKYKDELERYDPGNVAEAMFNRKERKIPGSVLKPHSLYVNLVVSNVLKSNTKQMRVLFPYPAYCFKLNTQDSFLVHKDLTQDICNDKEQVLKIVHNYKMLDKNMTLGFKVHDSTHVYNSVVNTMKAAGIRICPPNSGKWNIIWTGICKPEMLKDASKYQKINHFPNSFQLGRKDLMWKNIQRASRMFQGGSNEYSFCPKTYIFPDDYRKFCIDREASGYKHMYILKPSASSCGKGIKVVGQKTQVTKKGGYVCSQYVSNPHLIDGLKYDMRVYVVVTCFEPLKIFMLKEGLVRFATQKYSNNPKMLEKRFIHLTNYSVNKKSEDFVKSGAKGGGDDDGEDASKWNLFQLKNWMTKNGIDYEAVRLRMKDVIIKTCIAHEPQITGSYSRCTKNRNVCFEIYGFDILLDNKLKPHLLEINISPSLSSSSPLDKKIKTTLICDTLNLIGVTPYDRKTYDKELENVLKKRLLGLDKQTTAYKMQQQSLIKAKSSSDSTNSPVKNVNGYYQYSKDKKINVILNNLGLINSDEQNLYREVSGFNSNNNVNGCFSVPHGSNGVEPYQLSEEELSIIVDYEEESSRLGNFERIFPLASNAQHYSRYFEHVRPSNELLVRYLRTLSNSQSSGNTAKQGSPTLKNGKRIRN